MPPLPDIPTATAPSHLKPIDTTLAVAEGIDLGPPQWLVEHLSDGLGQSDVRISGEELHVRFMCRLV